MKLNLYLFKSEVQEFNLCLRPKTESRQYELINSLKEIEDVKYEIYIIKGDAKKPKWLSFIEGFVSPNDTTDVLNKNCSMVLLFKVNTIDGIRIFAVCHGFGYHIIDRNKIEENFGLITSLNCIDRNKIKSMDTRSLGIQTLQKKEASNLYTNLGEFAFEFDEEILQTISGAVLDKSIATKMGGTDNLILSTSKQISLEELPSKCKDVFAKFKQETYKENFAFVDNIKYVKDQLVIEKLDNLLVEAINQRSDTFKISVVYPDQIDYEKSESFKLSGLNLSKKKNMEVQDVTLKDVYKYIDDFEIDIEDLKGKIKIIGLDESGNPLTNQESLYTFLVYETDVENKKYILSNKKWYFIESDYLLKVQGDLEKIVTNHTTPILKKWNLNNDEETYNLLYKNEPDYLWLDKQNYAGKNFGRSKIEIADFFHEPTKELFFVKKLNRSATLSHLFSQATVSADLFKESDEYKNHFLDMLKKQWPQKASVFTSDFLNEIIFVYAIGVIEGKGEILDVIPVFSKINLLRHLKLLRKFNFAVQIAKIDIS